MTDTKKVKLVVSDSRGRISLKKFTDNETHTVEVDDDGVITLTPVVVMPARAVATAENKTRMGFAHE